MLAEDAKRDFWLSPAMHRKALELKEKAELLAGKEQRTPKEEIELIKLESGLGRLIEELRYAFEQKTRESYQFVAILNFLDALLSENVVTKGMRNELACGIRAEIADSPRNYPVRHDVVGWRLTSEAKSKIYALLEEKHRIKIDGEERKNFELRHRL